MTTDNRTNGQIVAKALVAHCEEHKMPFPRGSVKKIVEALRVAGRLAGEPTEAQVEAAARVIWEMDNTTLGISPPESLEAWEYETEGYLELARAVLEAAARAAQGAAPQAESAECDRDRMGICKRCGMGWDARKVLDGDFACPVLPSSGVGEDDCWHEANCRCVRAGNVDEDALAEEIGRHKLVHVAVSRKSAFCVCNPSVTAGVDDNLAWFAKHRARAVAEWLAGKEKNE